MKKSGTAIAFDVYDPWLPKAAPVKTEERLAPGVEPGNPKIRIPR
ncbi:hypothetical protein [Niabella sp.]|nr:hypothetical protein [Niabella sp.]